MPKPPVATQQSSFASDPAQPVSPSRSSATPADTPRTLWMGDLDPWLDEPAIANLWWHVLHVNVEVKVIKPRSLRSDPSYMGLTHSGYCFVEFPTYEDAQRALSLNGQLLPDIAMPSQQHVANNHDNQKKYFRLNWASGATLAAPIVHSPEYSLFVGDLSASTTEAHLLSFFQESFPTSIKTVRVMTDPVSGKSRCFGFVRFTDDDERQRALVEMNGAWFGGRPLRVALATPRNYPQQQQQLPPPGPPGPRFSKSHPSSSSSPAPQPHPQAYLYDHNRDFIYMAQSAPQSAPPSSSATGAPPELMTPYQMGFMAPQGHPFLDPANTTVFVGGLSSEVTEQTLFTLFKPFGIIQNIKIPPGKNCGFLKYSTREEAEEAILAMEGFIIGGNRVRLGWGRVSPGNKKFQNRRNKMAHVAQMQAAAAMSMGMDPAAAFAAAAAAAASGFPPPPPPPLAGVPGSSLGYGSVPLGMAHLPHGMAHMPHGMAPGMGPGMGPGMPHGIPPGMPLPGLHPFDMPPPQNNPYMDPHNNPYTDHHHQLLQDYDGNKPNDGLTLTFEKLSILHSNEKDE